MQHTEASWEKVIVFFVVSARRKKKVKGDKASYRKIDVDIPVNAAKMAKDAGYTNYLLVSAVGANAQAANFYLRLKGEVEKEIIAINFNSFHVFRPGILLGDRQEFRLGERIGKVVMQTISGFLLGNLQKYKGIDVAVVARAMAAAAKSGGKGMFTHHYQDMIKYT